MFNACAYYMIKCQVKFNTMIVVGNDPRIEKVVGIYYAKSNISFCSNFVANKHSNVIFDFKSLHQYIPSHRSVN